MLKLQQFDIYAFNFSRLKNNNFNLTNITPYQAKLNDEVISLADNEVLRAIRRITNHPYDKEKYNSLCTERRELYRNESSDLNKQKIKEINSSISEQLFISEYISVTTDKKSDYSIIGKNGFKINGKRYVRLLCSAAHARTNRTMFVLYDIYEQLNTILKNGANKIKMVAAKYNAYYSLTSSATYTVSKPRVCVVADKEIKQVKRVDWVTENSYQDTIQECDKELNFNLWDGMGIISPEFAEQWAKDLDLDYLPSAFCIRSAYIKGMVCLFDFKKFAKEIAHKKMITDVYGISYAVEDIDLIITQSQFKLWSAYNSWQHYEYCLRKSGINWGISKVTPKEDKEFIRTNYQFLQVLKMSDSDIQELCEPTTNWIKSISGGDAQAMSLYLMGKLAKESEPKKIWDSICDSYLKALFLCPELIKDNYIKNRIVTSLNKRIKESYIGKLLIEGNFQTMVNDPYAFCEHIFGLEVKGLLKEHEHFSWYWNQKGVKKVAAMRSPLTWRSEINLLNLQDNAQTSEWYKYLNNVVIYNIWGYDMMLHAGADVDGDLVCTTNNPTIIKCCTGGIPVAYEQKKAEKIEIKENNLYRTDLLAYDPKIGFITNCSTTLYEIQSKYPIGSKEYDEIDTRLKLCCKEQSATIDSAKGIKCKQFPRHWTIWQNPEKKKDVSEEEYEKAIFNNSILIDKRPYFMRYLYPAYNKLYNAFLVDVDRYSYTMYKCGYTALKNGLNGIVDTREIDEYYEKKNPLLLTSGTMNRICYHMERELSDVKKSYSKQFDSEVAGILYNSEIPIYQTDIEPIRNIYNEYKSFRSNKLLGDSEFSTYQQFYKHLRNKCLEEINSSLKYLANLAVFLCYCADEGNRDFVWDCFGNGVVLNLIEKYKVAKIPTICGQNEKSDIEYLGQKYKIEELSLY